MYGRITWILTAVLCLPATALAHNEEPSTAQANTQALTQAPAQHGEAVAVLYQALRGTRQAIEVSAYNLANARTLGYKAQTPRFTDNGGEVKTVTDFTTGSPMMTGQDFDMMIDGRGFFRVALPGSAGRTAYTRVGNFSRNLDGDLVLGNYRGPRLEPPLNIPEGTVGISITPEGEVSGVTPGSNVPTVFGQVELATFINTQGLERADNALFLETEQSGPPIEDTPGSGNLGTILHKFVESSNVDPETEMAHITRLNWRHEDLRRAIVILTDTRKAD